MIKNNFIFNFYRTGHLRFKGALSLIRPLFLILLFSSCINFNSDNNEGETGVTNNNPNNPFKENSLHSKVKKGMANIKGHTFSLQNTIQFSLKGSYSKEKLTKTQLVILNEDQNIITSLPASLVTKPVTLNIKGSKKLFIREVFNKSSIITRIPTSTGSLNYGLKL